MPFPDPIFPGSIWDGLTDNRNRVNDNSRVGANADDYDRLASEMISVQTVVSALSGQVNEVTTDVVVAAAGATVFVDASSGPVLVTLPSVAVTNGQVVVSKRDATANAVTVQGPEPINGETNQVITTQYTTISVQSGSTEWGIV